MCACVVRVGCGTPSQGLGTRDFETLTEPKFGVGWKVRDVRLREREDALQLFDLFHDTCVM